MCADFRGSTTIKIAELRRLELIEQAEQYRLSGLAVAGNTNRDRRHIDLRGAMEMLATRLSAMRRSRDFNRPIDLEPTASNSA